MYEVSYAVDANLFGGGEKVHQKNNEYFTLKMLKEQSKVEIHFVNGSHKRMR